MSTQNSRFELKDGRILGFNQYGKEDGYPILLFHGTPNSRLMYQPDSNDLEQLNAKLIILERPGYGISDPQPQQTVSDWTHVVKEFINFYSINKFSVAGISGGAPYALACSYHFTNQVETCSIISGFAPININKELTNGMSSSNQIGFSLASKAPWLLKQILKPIAKKVRKNPEETFDKFMSSFAKNDQAIIKQPSVRNKFIKDMKQAYSQGINGHYEDLIRLVKPWGINLEEISVPVNIWQGEQDQNVPISMARYYDKTLPNSKLHLYEQEGHLLYIKKWNEILTKLVP
ncbi:alpha/beta hydrolase [Filobacillus milosensis]|uniref:Alpha/beta hydrolase n=1 Tax=Filobacillus milosensis TaxID=94137 RepID=A0A4Y8IT81_9BACI|nr:alpha/beta hydrolase [Filobacillus milosensis]TFB25012.1 alpha/beta hydrolase [Filobacillus milosensis]